MPINGSLVSTSYSSYPSRAPQVLCSIHSYKVTLDLMSQIAHQDLERGDDAGMCNPMF